MKWVFPICLSLALMASLCSCGNSAVSECESLINEIGTIDTRGNFNLYTGEFIVDEDGIKAFEAANSSYNELSEQNKAKVENYELLENERENYTKAKELLTGYQALQIIYEQTKEAFVKEIKSAMKNPSSFTEVGYVPLFSIDFNEAVDEVTGEFEFPTTLTYSGSNSFGGQIQEEARATISGIYQDGAVSDIEVDIFLIS